jgi:hypothetical protein
MDIESIDLASMEIFQVLQNYFLGRILFGT